LRVELFIKTAASEGRQTRLFVLIIKFGGDLLSNLAGFYYKIWLDFIIKFGGKEDSSVD
jgi:hypothetical protein